MAEQNQDWLKEFEPIEEPVANAGALVLPGAPKEPTPPSPTRATEQWRPATPEEKARYGVDPNRAYQINDAGEIKDVGGQPTAKPATVDPNRVFKINSTLDQLANLRALADKSLSVGGAAGRVRETPVIGALLGQNRADLEGALAQVEGNLIQDQLAVLSQINPGGIASIANSESEARRLASSIANLDPNQSREQFLEGIARAEEYYNRQLEQIGGKRESVIRSSEQAGRAAIAPVQSGEAYQTEKDLAAQAQLDEAWRSGATADEIIDLNARLGRGPLSPADVEWLRANPGKPRSFYAAPSGTPTDTESAFGSFLSTPEGEAIGGYTMGAANALSLGLIDELAPILGLDANRVQAAKEYLRKKSPNATLIGDITGGVLSSIPAVRGASALLGTTRAAGAAPLIGETALGAMYGAGEAPEGQRLEGALIGGVGAAAGGALANRFLPGGPGTFSGVTPAPAQASRFAGPQVDAMDVISAGRQAGIPVMTSDVRPPETFMGKVTQQLGEITPFGTAGQRRTQQEAREQAVEDLLSEAGLSANRDVAPDLVRSLIEKRGADLTKFTDMKREVIERYAGMGDVTPIKSLDAIDRLVASIEGENLPRQLGPLLQDLRDIKTSLSSPGDLTKIERNRATVFDLKADPSLAKISSKSEKAFGEVYKSLNDDIGDFIKANGDMRDFNRWKVANTKLAMMAGELKQGGLKRVLDKGDFDPATVTRMLTSNNPQEARLLFTNLGKKGRENARLLLLQNAANKALDPTTQVVNPTVFAREVSKLKDNFGQFFSGADGRRVKGLVDVLNATRRAQEAQFAPRTGERVVPFAAAGGLGGLGTLLGLDFGIGVGLATGFGVAKRAYESPPVRDLLIRIGKATGSEKGKLITEVMQRISAATATTVAERVAGPEVEVPADAIIVNPAQ